ncbi:MAG: type I secretion system permease/ATPase [Boseongicola sp.]|nr:type I secretion system permease/ATPase [Boseongicola sp.]MDD9977115.1 type I secretion system permease/ATPase [Boseongicola sp.]
MVGTQKILARLLTISFLFSIFINLLMLTGPLFMLQVYDRVLSSRSQETLVVLTVFVVCLYTHLWLLDMARARVLSRLGAKLQTKLEQPIFLGALRHRNSERKATVADLNTVQRCIASPAVTAVLDLPFSPLFFAAIFIFHPLLGWTAIAGGLMLIVLTITSHWMSHRDTLIARKRDESARIFAESIAADRQFILGQNLEDRLVSRWSELSQAALAAALRTNEITQTMASLTKAVRLALQSIILAVGAFLVLQSQITAGAMIAASILLGRALAPVEQIIARWSQIDGALQSWKRVRKANQEKRSSPPTISLPEPKSGLKIEGVTLSGGPGQPALLYNVSLSVQPGEAVGVIGRSGSGKTTLARVACGELHPSIGEVRLGGALMRQYAGEDLSRYIGYLPQSTALLPGTLGENISRFTDEASSNEVTYAAQIAGAHDLITMLKDGYDTLISPASKQLSGGQSQRIALARAVYGGPRLIILDEPNSALDADGTTALNAAIRQEKSRGAAILLMTHRPTAISECDRLAVIERGRLVGCGPREEVLRKLTKNPTGLRLPVPMETSA